jgi:hypothetical protein
MLKTGSPLLGKNFITEKSRIHSGQKIRNHNADLCEANNVFFSVIYFSSSNKIYEKSSKKYFPETYVDNVKFYRIAWCIETLYTVYRVCMHTVFDLAAEFTASGARRSRHG